MKEKDNSGVLFKVAEKKTDKHPDMTGKCMVNGKEMNIAVWNNTSKDGRTQYCSLKFSDYTPKNTDATPPPEHEDLNAIPF